MTVTVPAVEQVPWAQFVAPGGLFDWRQGEHVGLIGPTGGGKTTLTLAIIDRRRYPVLFATKPKDGTLSGLTGRRGTWRKVSTWPPPPPSVAPRVVLWPRISRSGDEVGQAATFTAALDGIYHAGGYAPVLDDLLYIYDYLGIRQPIHRLYYQGRSVGVSLISSVQRPAHAPLLVYDQSTHLFFWRDNDEANLKRIGGLGGTDSKIVRATVAGLARHEVLYLNTRTGAMFRTRVERTD